MTAIAVGLLIQAVLAVGNIGMATYGLLIARRVRLALAAAGALQAQQQQAWREAVGLLALIAQQHLTPEQGRYVCAQYLAKHGLEVAVTDLTPTGGPVH